MNTLQQGVPGLKCISIVLLLLCMKLYFVRKFFSFEKNVGRPFPALNFFEMKYSVTQPNLVGCLIPAINLMIITLFFFISTVSTNLKAKVVSK